MRRQVYLRLRYLRLMPTAAGITDQRLYDLDLG